MRSSVSQDPIRAAPDPLSTGSNAWSSPAIVPTGSKTPPLASSKWPRACRMTDPTTQFVHFSTFILVNEQVVELAQLPGMGAAKHHHLLPPRDCELGHHLGPHLPSRLVVVKLCHDPGFWHHCRRCMADRPHCHTLFTYLNGLQ